jgi:hypothetical protein
MSRTTSLSLELRRRSCQIAREKLHQALKAMAHFGFVGDVWQPAPCQPQLEALVVEPLTQMPIRPLLDAHWLIAKEQDEEWNDCWERVLWRHGELLAEYRAQPIPEATEEERRRRLASLMTVSAAVMIPLFCRRGDWAAALELADTHLEVILSQPYQDVFAAGSDRDLDGTPSPFTRFLMLSPVTWSVAGYWDLAL